MKLERTGDKEQGKKRQYMPYKLKWKCPKCGLVQYHRFDKYSYLSYPVFDKEYEVALFCDNEDCNENAEPVTIVKVLPRLTMELIEQEEEE